MFPLFHGVKQIWVSHMECSLHARLSLEIAPWNEPDRMVILLFIVYFDTQNSFDDSFLLRNSRLEKARWSHNTCHMMRFMRFLCFHNTIANNGAAKTCLDPLLWGPALHLRHEETPGDIRIFVIIDRPTPASAKNTESQFGQEPHGGWN